MSLIHPQPSYKVLYIMLCFIRSYPGFNLGCKLLMRDFDLFPRLQVQFPIISRPGNPTSLWSMCTPSEQPRSDQSSPKHLQIRRLFRFLFFLSPPKSPPSPSPHSQNPLTSLTFFPTLVFAHLASDLPSSTLESRVSMHFSPMAQSSIPLLAKFPCRSHVNRPRIAADTTSMPL